MIDSTTRPTRVDTHEARAYAAALDTGSVRGHASADTIRDLAADLDATREELARALAKAALVHPPTRRVSTPTDDWARMRQCAIAAGVDIELIERALGERLTGEGS